jgi:hypothetical protein
MSVSTGAPGGDRDLLAGDLEAREQRCGQLGERDPQAPEGVARAVAAPDEAREWLRACGARG